MTGEMLRPLEGRPYLKDWQERITSQKPVKPAKKAKKGKKAHK